jgi:hypothetical protein
MIQIRPALFSILLGLQCVASSAAPTCDAAARHDTGYTRSIQAVQRLPELAAWSRLHSFPVAYGQSMDKQLVVQGRCYWSVSVYANRPERQELWHIFYVDVSGKRLLVQDPVSGDAISLQKWRSQNRKRVS